MKRTPLGPQFRPSQPSPATRPFIARFPLKLHEDHPRRCKNNMHWKDTTVKTQFRESAFADWPYSD